MFESLYLRQDNLASEVAAAAEESHPRQALRLYQQAAQELIEQRGRGNYATAAGYLRRVKALYERLGAGIAAMHAAWRTLIAGIREQNPKPVPARPARRAEPGRLVTPVSCRRPRK